MAGEHEWYEEGVTTNAAGERVRWACVQTTIPSENLPNSQERGPLGAKTVWEQGPWPVTTIVGTGMEGYNVLAKAVDGSDRAALEAEHRRVVELLKTDGLKAVRP
jgi:hypothetical protein